MGWRALGLKEKLRTGLAKESARPIIFGEDTVAVWMPETQKGKGWAASVDGVRWQSKRGVRTNPARPLPLALTVAALRNRVRERPLHEITGEDRVGRRVEELRAGEAAVRAEGWGAGRARLLGRALTVAMPPSESVKNSSTFGPTPSSGVRTVFDLQIPAKKKSFSSRGPRHAAQPMT